MAAAFISRIRALLFGLAGFHKTAMREAPGTTAFSSSSRFASISGVIEVDPVMFPPGRAMLETTPAAMGSPITAMTIGRVLVPSFAARAAGVPAVTMTSTLRLTASATNAG